VLTAPAEEAEEDEEEAEVETADETEEDPTISDVSLTELGSTTDGTLVRTSGSVVAEPGLFHTSGFYIAHESGAALVVPGADVSRDWLDDVAVGDHGDFVGKVEMRASGVRLVLEELPELEAGDPLQPVDATLGTLNAHDVGRLVRVSGTVSRRSGKSFRLAENNTELLVSIRKSSKITTPAPKKGSPATAVGIVLAGSGDAVVIAPRSAADLAGSSKQSTRLPASGAPLALPLLVAFGASSCAYVLRWRFGSIRK
jgi:hypothetical protein